MISAREGSLITCRLGDGPGAVAWKGSKPGASEVAPPTSEAAALVPVATGWPSKGTSPLQPPSCAAIRRTVREHRPGNRASNLALLQGRERLVEFLERGCPCHLFAVDKERRRRTNAEAIGGA